MDTHTVGVERLTGVLALEPMRAGMLAVVERYEGDVVKVCAYSAEISRRTLRREKMTVRQYLNGIAENYARAYGAQKI